ncbi:hypothetical protein DZB84_18500 [Bacillus sp. HNG]|nr:hypothetical protein DZB84_18500 [Bacillus sp. HNG]
MESNLGFLIKNSVFFAFQVLKYQIKNEEEFAMKEQSKVIELNKKKVEKQTEVYEFERFDESVRVLEHGTNFSDIEDRKLEIIAP